MVVLVMAAKGFSDLNAYEWRAALGGALFVCGLAFIAYLAREHC